MNKFLTRRFAINGLLLILSLVVLFHLLVIIRVIPFDIVWGGKLKNVSQMRSFEAVSVLLNLLMLAVVAMHAGILRLTVSPVIIKIALWTMFVLFLVNTFANMLSENAMEKIIFTPLTFLLSMFSLRLAVGKG